MCQVLSSWLASVAVIGARGDLKDVARMKFCPACRGITDEIFDLTLQHVLQVCEAVAPFRDAGTLSVFFAECKARGLASTAAYTLYLTGKAPDGSPVPRRDYMERGDALENLRREWLTTWGQS